MIKIFKINDWMNVVTGLLAITIAYSFSSTFYFIFFALFFIYIIKQKQRITIPSLRKASSYWFLFLFVFAEVFSLFYSKNIGFGMTQFEKRIPFILLLILGLLFSNEKPVNFKIGIRYYSIGVVFLMLLAISINVYEFYFGNLQAIILYNGAGYIDIFRSIGHRTYVGFIVVMAIPIWYKQVETGKTFRAQFRFFALIILAMLFVLLSGARGVLISLIVIISYLISRTLLLKFGPKFFVFGIILIGSLAVVGITQSQRFELVVEAIMDGNLSASKEPRVVTWESAFEVAMKKPFFGHGMGDAKDLLLQVYEEKNFALGEKGKFNSHNQYLESFMNAGVLALFGLLGFLVSLLFIKGEKRVYAITFSIVCGINLLFESMWVRNMGVFPAAFWLLLLLSSDNKQLKLNCSWEKPFISWALIVMLILITGLFWSSVQLKFQPNNPKSYMQIPFNNKMEMIEGVSKINTAKIPLKSLEFIGSNNTKFFNFPFYNTNDNIKKNVSASVWVKVSKNSNLDRVWLYIYNKRDHSYFTDYSLEKSGAWQHLVIDEKSLSKSFEIGLRIDRFDTNFGDFKEGNEFIQIAVPEYAIQ